MKGQPIPSTDHLKFISDPVPQPSGSNARAAHSERLHQIVQLQLEQLITQFPIKWAQAIYIDPVSAPQRHVVQAARTPLPPKVLAYLHTEAWLVDFPPVLALNPIAAEHLGTGFYFCPCGYQQQQCQYLLLQIEAALSSPLQQAIQQSAELLSKHLEIHLEIWQQSSQIQLLEQIVQRVGHQLRHPLSLINLYAENLCHGLPQGQGQEQAHIIREVSQDLDRNLTELIYCSCSEALRVTLQDLRSLVSESVQRFQAGIAQKQLKVQYPDFSIILRLDRSQMQQVFDNLLSNAIHFSPQGGTIMLNWQIFHGEVLVTIADEGAGLSPDDLRCLFNPFYSRRTGGVGLGLAIARKVVLDHQGNLWAKNLSTKGAEFSMILPRTNTLMTQSENVAC